MTLVADIIYCSALGWNCLIKSTSRPRYFPCTIFCRSVAFFASEWKGKKLPLYLQFEKDHHHLVIIRSAPACQAVQLVPMFNPKRSFWWLYGWFSRQAMPILASKILTFTSKDLCQMWNRQASSYQHSSRTVLIQQVTYFQYFLAESKIFCPIHNTRNPSLFKRTTVKKKEYLAIFAKTWRNINDFREQLKTFFWFSWPNENFFFMCSVPFF